MPKAKPRKPPDVRARARAATALHDWTELYTAPERWRDHAGLPESPEPVLAKPKPRFVEARNFPVAESVEVRALRTRLNWQSACKAAADRARETDRQSAPNVADRPKPAPYARPKPEPETLPAPRPLPKGRAMVRVVNLDTFGPWQPGTGPIDFVFNPVAPSPEPKPAPSLAKPSTDRLKAKADAMKHARGVLAMARAALKRAQSI